MIEVGGIEFGLIDVVIVLSNGFIYFIDVLMKYLFGIWYFDMFEG